MRVMASEGSLAASGTGMAGHPVSPAVAPAPLLYEVATRPWLARLSERFGRSVNLGDVPDAEIERIAGLGFDHLWPMGVWRTGEAATRIAREQPWLRERWREAFPGDPAPGLTGSPYAVSEYAVEDAFGGEAGLERLRERLTRAGLALVLDFVPHHTAIDAPWVREHPEWYVAGDEVQRGADAAAFLAEPVPGTRRWIAHCRDPYFPPWSDAAPLDYRSPAVQEGMIASLRSIAARCDGVRADMAMLVLADVFRATWNERSLPPLDGGGAGEFWPAATAAVRADRPQFLFIAEAYWDLEWRLQQAGFDYTYDKTFRDRLVAGDGPGLAAHLRADVGFQRRSVRFLENHDEDRAAAVLPIDRHRAGAVLAGTVPGLWLVHDGQLEGARFRSPVQFARHPDEPVDGTILGFYERLLGALARSRLRHARPLRLEPHPAWAGNPTHGSFVAHLWSGPGAELRLAVVNLGPTTGQCRLSFPLPRDQGGRQVELVDLLGEARYERSAEELRDPGLYLDLPAQAFHLFDLRVSHPDD